MSTEQEYEAQADMVDDQDPSESSGGPGPYPAQIPQGQQQQQMLNQQQQHLNTQAMQLTDNTQAYGTMTQQLMDPYDPMLDMDPFGLSASMQFPTQFSFDTSSMR